MKHIYIYNFVFVFVFLCLLQVERQRLKSEEGSMRLTAERSRLDRSLNTAEQELQEAQQQILMLQVRKPMSTVNTCLELDLCD